MGGGHKNDQIKCKNYDVEIEYEGIVIFGCIDFDGKICCWQLRNSEILSQTTICNHFHSGHMKEMIENFNRYQIINESTGNVIKVSSLKHLKVF